MWFPRRTFQHLRRPALMGMAFGGGIATAVAQTAIFETPLSPRIANYDIKVTLNDEAKRIDGDMVLTWNNPSDDRIEELQFHLCR